MRKEFLLVVIMSLFTLNLYAQVKEYNEKRIIKRINIKHCLKCKYDIIYENSHLKVYFSKSKILKFIDSSKFKSSNAIQSLRTYIDSIKGSVTFYNPYWAIDVFPKKFRAVSKQADGFTAIINANTTLKMSELFENVIGDYLVYGECKIFNKKKCKFYKTSPILLMWFKHSSKDKFTSCNLEGEYYQLPDGIQIIDKYVKASLGDDFSSMKPDPR